MDSSTALCETTASPLSPTSSSAGSAALGGGGARTADGIAMVGLASQAIHEEVLQGPGAETFGKNLLKNTFFGKYSDYYMDGDAAGANILCCCMGICLTPNLEKVNGRFVAGGPMTLCCCIETRDINNCKSAQTVRPIWDIVAGGGSHPNRPGNLNFLPPSIRTTYSKHTDVQTTVVIDGTDSRTHAEYQETTQDIDIEVTSASGEMLYSKSIHKKYDNQWMECFPCFALMGCANTTEFFAFEEFHTESAESAISIETPRPASVYNLIANPEADVPRVRGVRELPAPAMFRATTSEQACEVAEKLGNNVRMYDNNGLAPIPTGQCNPCFCCPSCCMINEHFKGLQGGGLHGRSVCRPSEDPEMNREGVTGAFNEVIGTGGYVDIETGKAWSSTFDDSRIVLHRGTDEASYERSKALLAVMLMNNNIYEDQFLACDPLLCGGPNIQRESGSGSISDVPGSTWRVWRSDDCGSLWETKAILASCINLPCTACICSIGIARLATQALEFVSVGLLASTSVASCLGCLEGTVRQCLPTNCHFQRVQHKVRTIVVHEYDDTHVVLTCPAKGDEQ